MIYDTSNPVTARHAAEYLERLTAKGYSVEVKHVKKNRSKWQNAWFHAVVAQVSDFTGYEKEEAKEILKRKGGLAYKKKGHVFLRSTAKLDVKEFGEFMDKIIRVCAQELDLVIPDPEHYKGR
jgi:hypothetical protein